MFEPRQPVEAVCRNELFPWNTVFRSGVPVAFIDWDSAAPGRAWDLGLAAWRWVPFSRDEKCRAAGLPTGIADKARRFRSLLDAYGIDPDIGIVLAGIERVRQLLEQLRTLVADGSEGELELARRGVLDELALEIAWVDLGGGARCCACGVLTGPREHTRDVAKSSHEETWRTECG
jgi:hypothetical protein